MHDLRRERLFGPEGPAGTGLEIGALASPMLVRPAADVLYVDYAPTEVLRANQFDPSVRTDKIVEVDVVWGEVPLRKAVGRTVDFVAACHVIEHVPDIVGWLNELREVLKPGGTLGLVIPDKRFTFDALRRESTLAEAVEAYLLGYRRPSLRQVFDVASLGVGVDGGQVWRGAFAPSERRGEVLSRLAHAMALVRRLHETSQYRDAHCWVFTPSSFLTLVEELAILDLFPFVIDDFQPTEPNGAEFYVRLIAADAGDSRILDAVMAARASLATAATPDSRTVPIPEADASEEEAEAGGAQARAEIERLRGEAAAIRASTSWKLTAPLRAAVTRLSRRPGRS